MSWQDLVLTTGSLIFSVALFPSLLSKEKPALSTSLLTGTVLAIYAFTYTTLDLKFSIFSTSLLAVLWLIFGWQRWQMNKKGLNARTTH